jgi:transcriptional regulator with XRE-family HTH domain
MKRVLLRITVERIKKQMTTVQVGELLKIAPSSISQCENGYRPLPQLQAALCELYGMSWEELSVNLAQPNTDIKVVKTK